MPALTWDKPTRYAQVSACGRYSVAKIGFNGGAMYEAWQTRAHAEGAHLIATNLESAEAARKMVEAHDVETGE